MCMRAIHGQSLTDSQRILASNSRTNRFGGALLSKLRNRFTFAANALGDNDVLVGYAIPISMNDSIRVQVPRYSTIPMCDGALLEVFESMVRDFDVFVVTIVKCG